MLQGTELIAAATYKPRHHENPSSPLTSQPCTGETAAAKPADPADYTVSDAGVFFFTPSRNIACGLDQHITGCQVFNATAIPPGADCDHSSMPRDELSKGFYVDDSGVITPSCFNQGLFNATADQKVLPYGRSLTAAGTRCVSQIDGVTCTRGEHGFFVSAQGFRQW